MYNVDLKNWENDKNVGVQIGKEIERQYFKENKLLNVLAGKGDKRAIWTKTIEDLSPYRFRLKNLINGKGVVGNTDFADNRDSIKYCSSQIQPELFGNSVKSDVLAYERTKDIDFIKEASESLITWLDNQIQKRLLATVTNDFTNAVIADAANGVKDTSKEKDVLTASKKIKKGDVLTVKTIRRAITKAKNGLDFNNKGGFYIPPLSVNAKTENGINYTDEVYALFISSTQAEQLKSDTEWQDMQKYAAQRGDTNRLFTGSIGMIDNCVIIELGDWKNDEILGLPNSQLAEADYCPYVCNAENIIAPSAFKGEVDVEFGFLIGAKGLHFGSNITTNVMIEKHDAGRKVSVNIDKIVAIAKTRFNAIDNTRMISHPLNNKDYGVIGIISASE